MRMNGNARIVISALAVFAFVLLLCSNALAYTELHIQKNMYPKKEPDIITDTVTRTAGPGAIPVLLLMRHTDIFPTELESVEITAEFEGGLSPKVKKLDYALRLKKLWWIDTQYVDVPEGYKGVVSITAKYNYKIRGVADSVVNNNQRKSRHLPLKVLYDATPMPRFDKWYYGDSHFHTIHSVNQVEFGAPVDFSMMMADRFGMDWAVVTDHSFNMDDMEEDFTKNDPDLKKWSRQQEELDAARKVHTKMLILPGEELSCGNAENKNVHMVVLNARKFYVGNGDGYQGSNLPDLACADVTAQLAPTEAAFAAHPIVDITPVEIYMINRGNWSSEDMSARGLTGLESWNHDLHPRKEGFDAWIALLLDGKHKYLIGGTDSHGDFNAEFANFGYDEARKLPFGCIRTAVYVEGALTAESLIAGLRAGRAVATSGPLPVLELKDASGRTAGIGGDIAGGPFEAVVKVKSTSEFGPVSQVKVILGDLEKKAETVVADFAAKDFADPMNLAKTATVPGNVKKGYVRVEAYSQLGGVTYDSYTNPVWFER